MPLSELVPNTSDPPFFLVLPVLLEKARLPLLLGLIVETQNKGGDDSMKRPEEEYRHQHLAGGRLLRACLSC